MKCPYCGGEVSSQSVACPFCGRENPEGIAFQEEVQKKIERNKLLKPFLIRQKKPELVQRLLSRMIGILLIINIVMLTLTFIAFLLIEREPNRKPEKGSYAELYFSDFQGVNDYYFDRYYKNVIEFMEHLDKGEMADDYEVESLIDSARRALEESQEQEYQEEIYLHTKAFFEGVLGLTEEESAILEPDEEGEYGYLYSDDIRRETAIGAVKKKMKENEK